MDFRRNQRVTRAALISITFLNCAFTVVTMLCATIFIINYPLISATVSHQVIPSDKVADSANSSREHLDLRAVAAEEIRSATKKGRRNPLLVSTGLFIVSGIIIFGLIWMIINERLKLSQRFARRRGILMQRLRNRQAAGDQPQAENQGDNGQGAQTEAAGPENQEQAPGLVDQSTPTKGGQTLAGPVEVSPASNDIEAQYHVEDVLGGGGGSGRKTVIVRERELEHPDEE
ncbi:hypothetical protein Trco_005902 [Trichoderma cornu-damae]|uniref:Transmembrane protein n=1 Tax=Trichoderma cornu-damae TaxID=654480 RepID=A0A9P8QKD1_9HYPO|nr:hypothetical protein Trco_005902 [Trichoderma cornu-damae]